MEENLPVQNKLFGKTFFWMFLGLLGTAIVAWYTYTSDLYINIIWDGAFGYLLLIELVAVLLFSFLFRKLHPIAVRHFVLCVFDVKWNNVVRYLCRL